jgi:hypothetical protein
LQSLSTGAKNAMKGCSRVAFNVPVILSFAKGCLVFQGVNDGLFAVL